MTSGKAGARDGRPPRQGSATDIVDWAEITLTPRCNQRCFFCYEDARGNAAQPTLEEVEDLLRQTGEHAEQVVLCGKEVLLRRDVVEIVEKASSMGLRTVVFTNGQALARPGLVESLARAGCDSVSVSFHFPDKETFERGARVKGKLFDRILTGFGEMGEHNRANPGAAVSVSVEIDMFALNAGRLKDMRDTISRAMGGGGWSLRLACLLPARIHDIGLDHVLDPLDSRREEIRAFVATQPEDVPLAFVKVPLCLVPEGFEHLSLDVRYVYEGTVLTFNHAESKRLTVDTFSSSRGRDTAKLLAGHPYRWICRSCSMSTICRFERLEWSMEGFHPTREQRPLPYRASGSAPTVVERLRLPVRSGAAPDVLERLGPLGTAEEHVKAQTAVIEEAYPEERILEALLALEAGPRLVDAWAERHPVLALSMNVDAEEVRLLLETGREGSDLGIVVGYLSISPVDRPLDDPRFMACVRVIAGLSLPSIEAWEGTPWFDRGRALLLDRAWHQLGERLWPAQGSFGSWRTTAARIDGARRLVLEMLRRDGAAGRLLFRLSNDGAALAPSAECADAAEEASLIEALADHVEAFGRMKRDGSARGDGLRKIGCLRVAVAGKARPDVRYEFRVGTYVAGRPHYRRAGDLALWYGHEKMDRSAAALCDLIMDVIAGKERAQLREANVPSWRAAIVAEAGKRGLAEVVDWYIEWEHGG